MRVYDDLAHLYDVAFSWNIDEEVAWLCERLGQPLSRVLEPGCGSGRMFPAFMERNIEVVGFDLSKQMLKRAAERVADLSGPKPELVEADMADFEFSQQVDGAICPINTFSYLLTDDDAQRHLACLANCLRPGGRYVVQLDLHDLRDYKPEPPDATNSWTMTDKDLTVRTTWSGVAWDPQTQLETQQARFEILDGENVKQVVDDHHENRLRNWASWKALINASAFVQIAAFDGNDSERPSLAVGPSLEVERLTWHVLELS